MRPRSIMGKAGHIKSTAKYNLTTALASMSKQVMQMGCEKRLMKILLIVGTIAMITIGSGMYVNDSDTYINDSDSGMNFSYFTEYLGNNPSTCNNCHVMDAVYEGWYHGDHKNHAVCADCHLPHDLVPKYIVKAESGFRDITAFISGNIPDTIRAMESSQEIVQENCRRCHAQTVENIADGRMDSGRYCFDCHRTVAHGERGISILPHREGQ